MSLLLRAGVLLGIGLGGLADSIVLHQLAQWHNLEPAVSLPHTMEMLRLNMTRDGWFEAAMWMISVVGVMRLWRAGQDESSPDSSVSLIGEMIFGWGLFNVAAGFIDHHALGIHHVRDLPASIAIYNWLFLGVGGFGFTLFGFMLTTSAPERLMSFYQHWENAFTRET